MFNTIFANDRIRPEDLCSRKQLIYLLSHNHCPQKSFYNICPFARLQRGRCQCDQIGRFLKFLATKFLPKEAQNNWQLLGYFEKPHSFGKTTTLGASFGKIGLLFTPTSGHTGRRRGRHHRRRRHRRHHAKRRD